MTFNLTAATTVTLTAAKDATEIKVQQLTVTSNTLTLNLNGIGFDATDQDNSVTVASGDAQSAGLVFSNAGKAAIVGAWAVDVGTGVGASGSVTFSGAVQATVDTVDLGKYLGGGNMVVQSGADVIAGDVLLSGADSTHKSGLKVDGAKLYTVNIEGGATTVLGTQFSYLGDIIATNGATVSASRLTLFDARGEKGSNIVKSITAY